LSGFAALGIVLGGMLAIIGAFLMQFIGLICQNMRSENY
jgi:hypothetical protein